jgi:hypothetical protein
VLLALRDGSLMRTILIESRTYGTMTIFLDEEDYETVMSGGRWHVSRESDRYYAVRHVRRPDGRWTTQPMHALVTGVKGVDHIDGNGLNNQRSNLRPATDAQNAQNRALRNDNVSGFRGVAQTRSGGWLAYAHSSGKQVYGGIHKTPEAAAVAARQLRAGLMPYVNEARLPQPDDHGFGGDG